MEACLISKVFVDPSPEMGTKISDAMFSIFYSVVSIKDKQKSLDEKFTHVESNSQFVDSHIKELQERVEERKDEISGCHKQILYLEAYSRRENLKFEGIPELPESSGQQNATSKEDTKEVLVDFMENVLAIEDAKDMEFQRVHRIGKPKSDNGNGRTIITRFLRFSDRERVLKCGQSLKILTTRCTKISQKNCMI